MDESCLGDERNEKDRKKRLSHTLKYIPKSKTRAKMMQRRTTVSSISKERKQTRKDRAAQRWVLRRMEKQIQTRGDNKEVHTVKRREPQMKNRRQKIMLLLSLCLMEGAGRGAREGGGWWIRIKTCEI